METTGFTPQLIGVDKKEIEKEIKEGQHIASELNYVKNEWEKLFNEKFSIESLEGILSIKNPEQIPRFIQIHILELNPVIGPILKSGQKPDKYIDEHEFSDFTSLQNAIVSSRSDLGRIFRNNKPLYHKMFDGKTFILPQEIQDKIIEKHSYFTKSEIENIFLEKIRSLCAIVNFFNKYGADINARDFPQKLELNISSAFGDIKKKELQGGYSGEPDWPIPKIVPDTHMFIKEGNSLLNNFILNFDKND